MLGAKRGFLSILLLAPALIAAAGRQATPPPPASPDIAILSPQAGALLQGVVPVTIHNDVPGLIYTELAFAYSGDATDTWFTLYEGGQAFAGQVAVEWDTGAITDGDYRLRLITALSDGSYRSVQIDGLRVRNYSPAEAETPTPAAPPPTTTAPPPTDPAAVETPPTAAAPTPEATTPAAPAAVTAAAPASTLPPNPAEISAGQVRRSAARGALAAVGLLALAGVYWSLRRLGRRS